MATYVDNEQMHMVLRNEVTLRRGVNAGRAVAACSNEAVSKVPQNIWAASIVVHEHEHACTQVDAPLETGAAPCKSPT
jgi:hypothetical protein